METDEVMEEVDGKVIGDAQKEEPREEAEAEEDEDEVEEEVEEEEIAGEDHPAAEGKKRRSKNPPKPFTRELGKSVLPFSRVQKIIRADKEIPMVAKDAVFLISIATEAFIEELAQAAQRVADKYNRSMIHHEDIATVARKADEFMFLEGRSRGQNTRLSMAED
ncbi:hypothetical protein AGABI2DRAFT_193750 [Agaricus bisporus var. bisporus H97]|uniref:hypothetical protein n=1 Tax=Agaricus bisporus var. bisporus (strain H97 / ATCC MYA-4626 / FGSC 10389) TaxID=936046 RepID=UPI00029F64F1|nr:hypothetical protein AGABI2DRAFT_193750 [Agaricus bisporus var. bisporus H97]EKV45821.1 hypothetical protein AGABI2DRAFT_193750 [Agaricus bisporus var. bisporus H97]